MKTFLAELEEQIKQQEAQKISRRANKPQSPAIPTSRSHNITNGL